MCGQEEGDLVTAVKTQGVSSDDPHVEASSRHRQLGELPSDSGAEGLRGAVSKSGEFIGKLVSERKRRFCLRAQDLNGLPIAIELH